MLKHLFIRQLFLITGNCAVRKNYNDDIGWSHAWNFYIRRLSLLCSRNYVRQMAVRNMKIRKWNDNYDFAVLMLMQFYASWLSQWHTGNAVLTSNKWFYICCINCNLRFRFHSFDEFSYTMVLMKSLHIRQAAARSNIVTNRRYEYD